MFTAGFFHLPSVVISKRNDRFQIKCKVFIFTDKNWVRDVNVNKSQER